MTRRLPHDVENLSIMTVLNVRGTRSEEMVVRLRSATIFGSLQRLILCVLCSNYFPATVLSRFLEVSAQGDLPVVRPDAVLTPLRV